jgi:hypothetical protein
MLFNTHGLASQHTYSNAENQTIKSIVIIATP